MVNRFKDFDAAWAEKVSPTLSVKVYGKKYKLPAALPAKVVLLSARLQAEKPGTDIPLDKVMELLEPFFGAGVLEKWADAGMDVDQMGDVLKWSMAVYRGDDPDATDDDEDSDPNS